MAKGLGLKLERCIAFQDPPKAIVDIVAVHGLDSNPLETWYSTLLPRDIPRARILLWGYNATSITSRIRLDCEARELLSAVADRKASKADRVRPVIFVAHGLGGIVLRQALIIARESGIRTLESIVNLTSAVVFLGTSYNPPEITLSGPKAKLAISKVAKNDITKFSTAWPNHTGNSSASIWRSQQVKFDSLWQTRDNFKVITFVEDNPRHNPHPAPKDRLLFNRYSQIPLQRDHLSLWQSQLFDPSYQLLAAEFKKLVVCNPTLSGHNQPTPAAEPPGIESGNIKLQAYLATLKSEDGRARVPAPAPGTLSWISRNPKFTSWLNRKANNWLWVCGKPGCGKSTLAKHLVDKGVEKSFSQDRITISYFFNYASPDQRSALGFFRSSLYQLLVRIGCTLYSRELETTFLDEIEDSISQNWVEDSVILARHLQLLISLTAQTHRIVFIIDGLDECDQQSAADIVKFLRNEAREPASDGLRICVTSRHDSLLAEGEAQVFVDSENSDDILSYISLQARGCKRECPHRLAQRLSNEILGKADGVFLWVRLVLMRLNQAFDLGENIFEVFCALPNDLRGLYKWLLGHMDFDKTVSAITAGELFKFILAAMRPLSVAELFNLTLLIPSLQKSSHKKLLKVQPVGIFKDRAVQFGKEIVSECSGLLCIDTAEGCYMDKRYDKHFDTGSPVHLVHWTVHEFLHDEWLYSLGSCNESLSDMRSRLHLEMAQCALECFNIGIMYLKTQILKDWVLASVLPFIKYAAAYWIRHLKEAEIEDVSSEHFDKFWQRYAGLPISAWKTIQQAMPAAFPEWLVTEGANTLHLASQWSLKMSTKAHLKSCHTCRLSDMHLNSVDGRGRTPILVAAEVGSWEIVQDLVNVGADVRRIDSVQGQSPLHWASLAGNKQIIEELIKAGADVNDSRNGTTPLTQSAAQGHKDSVQALLKHGADPCSSDYHRGQSALSLAILNRHFSVVALLLEHGADVNAKDAYSNFVPLQHAIMSRSPELVGNLLDLGAHSLPKTQISDPTRLEMWLDRVSRLLPDRGAVQHTAPSTRQHGSKSNQASSNQASNPSHKCSNKSDFKNQSRRMNTELPPNHHQQKRNRDDRDDDDEPPKKMTKRDDHDDDNLFACPFFKFDPIAHENCASAAYPRMHRLKDHLKRTHRVHRCTRCGHIEETEQDLINHKRASLFCNVIPRSLWDFSAGYDEDQAKEISLRHRGLAEKEKWKRIFQALFPQVDEDHIPEPFFEVVSAAQDQPDQLLQEYDTYRHQQRSSIVAALQSLIRTGGSAEDILTIVQESDAQIRERFLRDRPPWQMQTIQDTPAAATRNEPLAGLTVSTTDLFELPCLQGDAPNASTSNFARDSQFLDQTYGPNQQPDSGFYSHNAGATVADHVFDWNGWGPVDNFTENMLHHEPGTNEATEHWTLDDSTTPTASQLPSSNVNNQYTDVPQPVPLAQMDGSRVLHQTPAPQQSRPLRQRGSL